MVVVDEDYEAPSEADGFVGADVVAAVVDAVNTLDQSVEDEVAGATPSAEDQQHEVD